MAINFVCGRFFRMAIRLRLARGSRKAVGSSKRIVEGSMARTVAMEATRFSPPDSFSGERSRRLSMASSRRTSFTHFATSSSERPKLRGPKAMSSKTVGMKSWSSGFWNTMPTRRRISLSVFLPSSIPSASIFPENGSTPTRARSSDVFPAPLAPIKATDSLSPISKSRAFTACVPSG